jgi:hypothetical protein
MAAGCVSGLLIAAGVAMGAGMDSAGSARTPEPTIAETATSPNDPAVLDQLLNFATRDALREGEEPVARRSRLLARIAMGDACFIGNPTPAQLEAIAAMYGGRNPSERIGGFGNRFFLWTSAWDGNANTVTTTIGQAKPITLMTYSFPNDGVIWGPGGQLNRLSADLTGRLTPDTSVDPPLPAIPGPGVPYGRELFRQVMAGWQRACSVRYMEVCDDDAPLDNLLNPAPPALATHGDIRFGSYAQGEGLGVLAFNYYPELGGDMVLNSSYFVEPTDTSTPPYFTASNGYRYLRNTIAHEHGHGLGFRHVVPCNQQKLMEPFASTVYDTIQTDEKRGAQRNYGDRYAGNHTRATAKDLGEQWVITPGNPPSDPRYVSTGSNFKQSIPLDHTDAALGLQAHSVLERDLSTNGPTCPSGGPTCDPQNPDLVGNPTGQDWFRFTLERSEPVRISVDPTGLQYLNGAQLGSETAPCAGTTFSVNAEAMGDLVLELYRLDAEPDVTTLVGIANGAPAGQIEELGGTASPLVLPAGTYLVRVYDSFSVTPTLPDMSTQPTQLYDLSVRLGPVDDVTMQIKYPPYAIAGVDKHAPLNQLVQFIGDLLSRVQEPNTEPLNARIANFEWDLDGDGEFEINIDDFTMPPAGQLPNNPRFPFTTYTNLNRIIPVTLRVTDANGMKATDTIFVTVTGAPITIAAAVPTFVYRGATVPITIIGSGFGAVMDISQITLSGAGLTLGGVPMVDPTGTTITGLNVAVAMDAALGARDMRITDGCTAGFKQGAFIVLDAVPPMPEDQCDAAAAWTPGPGCKPFDNRGAGADPTQDWTMTSCEGLTLYHDVWYTWTSSQAGMLDVQTRSSDPGSLPGPFPTRVAVYRLPPGPITCPPAQMTLAACGETFTIDVGYQERLLFRVGSLIEGVPGVSCVNLSFATQLGACCNPDTGSCTINVSAIGCSGGTLLPANVCTPVNPCPQPLRRCCIPATGACVIVLEASCDAAGGVWSPSGTTCTPNPCPQPTGACCPGSGACTITTQAACTGSFRGVNTVCSPNPCPQPLGACCLPDGQCANAPQSQCGSGVWAIGQACTPSSCLPDLGACCVIDQACEITTQAACPGGWTSGVTCEPDPCPRMAGACCVINQACMLTERAACAGGWSAGTLCNPDPCIQTVTGACCDQATGGCTLTTSQATCNGIFNSSVTTCDAACPPPRGACCNNANGLCTAFVLQADCTTGAWTANAACSPTRCPPPTGACCVASSGVCSTAQTLLQCNGLGGVFHAGEACSPANCPIPGACCATSGTCTSGFATSCLGTFIAGGVCTPNPCAQPSGACCDGTSCTLVTAANCVAPGTFKGVGTICGTSGNPTTCCPANFNGVDGVTVQDIFDFLAAYFSGTAAGDFNGVGGVTVQDIFDFLDAYFAGCPGVGGACCQGTTCVVVNDAGACTGQFQGTGTVCGPTGNPTTCCPANLDGVGGVSLEDLFLFLGQYPVQGPLADFNGDGMVTVEDVFAYLRAFFAGCPG